MTAPWSKGKHEDYSAFVVEVYVRKDRAGKIHSVRALQDETDHATTREMEGSHGMAEASWALLMESVRAELMLQILVRLTKDPDYQQKLLVGEHEEELAQEMRESLIAHMHRGLEEVVPPLTKEALESVRTGFQKQGGVKRTATT